MIIEYAAQSVLQKVIGSYIRKQSPFYGDTYDSIIFVNTVFDVYGSAEKLLFADMHAEGASELAATVLGDVISDEVVRKIPIGNNLRMRIARHENRVVVEPGFIAGFEFVPQAEEHFRITGPHRLLGDRWERIDVNVLHWIIESQRNNRNRSTLYFNRQIRRPIEAGNIEEVVACIASGYPVEGHHDDLSSPLFEASVYGQTDIVKLLLSLGAHPDSPRYPDRPLNGAHRFKHFNIVDILLAEGARPNYKGRDSHSYHGWLKIEANDREINRPMNQMKRAWDNSFLGILWNEMKD